MVMLTQRGVHLSEMEKWLIILGYLEILDSDRYSSEEKMIVLNEAATFVKQNTDPRLTINEAHTRVFKYLFSYKEWRNSRSMGNFKNENHFVPKFVIENGMNTMFRGSSGENMPNPNIEIDREREDLQSEAVQKDLIENLIRKISYRHIIIQTLLYFLILLILLIKIDVISLFLSNPINQALIGISLAIFSFVMYVVASK